MEVSLKNGGSHREGLNFIRKSYTENTEEDSIRMNQRFKYLRFTRSALQEMKAEKWTETIGLKVKELWPTFIDIFTYCLYCTLENIQKNKFVKPLFSDATNPEDTLIGQLSLRQIMNEAERD